MSDRPISVVLSSHRPWHASVVCPKFLYRSLAVAALFPSRARKQAVKSRTANISVA
jgi:hypothetical protein